jgi:FkbM family methyltransferase
MLRALVRRFDYDLVRFDATSALSPHLTLLFQRLGINCVLDVGGHYGEYGRMLRDNGYTGRIVSFEPIAANFEALRSSASRDDRWFALPMGLGNEDGDFDINVMQGSGLDSFLQPSGYGVAALGESMQVARVERVKVRKLDSLFDECIRGLSAPRVYLKLDTQGWDLKVLAGADRSISRVLALQSETSVKHLYEGMVGFGESVRALEKLGFEMSGVFPVLQDPQFRAIELDVVMLRPEADEALASHEDVARGRGEGKTR